MNQRTEFSIWLRKMMDERDISINQLSKETYISRPTISAHLNGIHLPYRSSLRIYAKYFNYPYWDLYEMILMDSQ